MFELEYFPWFTVYCHHISIYPSWFTHSCNFNHCLADIIHKPSSVLPQIIQDRKNDSLVHYCNYPIVCGILLSDQYNWCHYIESPDCGIITKISNKISNFLLYSWCWWINSTGCFTVRSEASRKPTKSIH